MTSSGNTRQSTAIIPRSERAKSIQEGLADPKTARSTARLIRRAAREGWAVGPEAKKQIGKKIATLAIETEEPALANELARTLVMMDKTRFDQLAESHRIERLESGQSTENHAVNALTPDLISAALGRVNDTTAGG